MADDQAILVIDSNVAFASVLKESLEQEGGYSVTVASSGNEALQLFGSDRFRLAIVDLGLDGPDGLTLARTLREHAPDIRLMLIPTNGEDLPAEANGLDVQGILTKPFFFPELPGHVADALARPMGGGTGGAAAASKPEPEPEPEPSPPPPEKKSKSAGRRKRRGAQRGSNLQAVIADRQDEILELMDGLARDVNADVAILTDGVNLVTHTGRFSDEDARALARVVAEGYRTASRLAEILDRRQECFEQSVEGGEYILYSLAVFEDVVLSVALLTNVALGMIRHRTKETTDELRELLGVS